MDVVVSGSGPDRPYADNRTERLLRLIAVGVLLTAVFAGITSWTVYRQAEMERRLNCATFAVRFTDGGSTSYDDLDPNLQQVIDASDCDLPAK